VRTTLLLVLAAGAAFAQTPTITTVVNAATYAAPLCPGLLATIYGTNFGSSGSSVSVSVGGKGAYVYASNVTPTQVLIEIPFELAAGPSTVTVTVGSSQSLPFNITLGSVSPGILTQGGALPGIAYAFNSASALITHAAPAHPGDTLSLYAVGLGPTNPVTATGATGTANPTATVPVLTVGSVTAKITFAGVTTPGFYQINFVIPSTGVEGDEPLVISTGGLNSPAGVTLPIVGLSTVENNASFANPGTIAPGSIASVFANGLGSAATNEVSGLFPSTKSEDVQVTFTTPGGTTIAAPLFHVLPLASPQQIDLFVPSELPTSGTVSVQLTTSSANYPSFTLNMVPASPGLYRFTDPKTTTQYVIAQFANTAWLVLPASTTSALGLPACSATSTAATECGQPANIGDYLTIYMTGLGLATPNGNPSGTPLPTGQNPPLDGSVLYETPTLPTVTIGGVTAKVLFSGLVPGYAGEYQIDVQVPVGVTNGDNVPVVVTMLGASDTAAISIQPGSIAPPN
jgi:uncharacterized protein (TIGR03437 family)